MTDRHLTFHDDNGNCAECAVLVVVFLGALGVAWQVLAPHVAVLWGG